MVILRKKTKQKKERIGGNILVVAKETSVINPRGWHHGIYQVAGVRILVAVKSENNTVLMIAEVMRSKECEILLHRAAAWKQKDLQRSLWFSGVIKQILMQCCHLSGLLSLKSGLEWTEHKPATALLCEFIMYSMEHPVSTCHCFFFCFGHHLL